MKSQPSFEGWLADTARELPYPPAPAPRLMIAPPRPRRLTPRLAWALAVILLVFGLLLVPPVRATLIDWLTIGSVSISLDPAAPTPAPPAINQNVLPPESEQVTLEAAERRLGFTLTPPADLGPPSAVFLYDELGGMAALLWEEQGLLLHVISQDLILTKISPATYAEPAAVHNQLAYWVSGQRRLDLYDETLAPIEGFARVVEGPVLIWTLDEMTFRLETALERDEAIALAEQLVDLDK